MRPMGWWGDEEGGEVGPMGWWAGGADGLVGWWATHEAACRADPRAASDLIFAPAEGVM